MVYVPPKAGDPMKKRNLYIPLLIFTVLLSALLLRPRKGPGFTADPEAQKLHLQYEPGDGAPTNIVKSDTLNGHYEGNLFFVALQNVTIQLNGKYVPLETAIREGDISVEEIVAYARVDAKNGFCAEKEHTENGLSQFTYDYGDYRINTIFRLDWSEEQ